MGNCVSDEVKLAISQDGQENVKQAAIIQANQEFLDKYTEQIKPNYILNLQKKRQEKQQQIHHTKDVIVHKFQQKKIALQTLQTGTIQNLQNKNHLPFSTLTGEDQALQKLEQLENRTKQVYGAQTKKIIEDIVTYKEDLKFQVQKMKKPLTHLMSFGQDQKHKILNQIAQKNEEQVKRRNKLLQEQLDKEYQFEEIHRKRCQEWIPKMEFDQIIKNFEDHLAKIQAKKQRNNAIGCF